MNRYSRVELIRDLISHVYQPTGSIFSINLTHFGVAVEYLHLYLYTLHKMPAAISKPRNKGKARADPYEKVTASMPLGKQLAHTGASNSMRDGEMY